jgi:hypothetical protein
MKISNDSELVQPASILFAMYNLLVKEESQTAFNCLKNVESANPRSLGNVAGHVIRSAYLAYNKKYALKHLGTRSRWIRSVRLFS